MTTKEQLRLKSEAIANVKAWMKGRPLEELTAIFTPDGNIANTSGDSYVTLARIAGGTPERNAHLPAAWHEIKSLFVERIRELRYLPIAASEAVMKAKRKQSKTNTKNAKGERGPQKDDKQLRQDAVTYAKNRQKAGLSKKRSCELAVKQYGLECTWQTVRNDMDKGKRSV